MKPPFIGTKIIDDIDPQGVFDLINRDVLYAARWELKGDLAGDAWRERIRDVADPTFERMVEMCFSREIIRPRVVHGYVACSSSGNLLFVKHENRRLHSIFRESGKRPIVVSRTSFPTVSCRCSS